MSIIQNIEVDDRQAEEILDYMNQNSAPVWEFLSR